MKVVLMGFNIAEENAIIYRKIEIKKECADAPESANVNCYGDLDKYNALMLGKMILSAIEKDCHFVSIRFIECD